MTGALGFTELKHEGKITGLAAFGQPKYLREFYSLEVESRNVPLTDEEEKR